MLIRTEATRAGILLATLATCLWTLGAADAPPPASEELQRKTEQIERLQQELERALTDLKRLEQENEKLRHQPPLTAPLPSVQVTNLPPLDKGETLEIDELVAQFHSDPAAATRRYDRQRIRVRGTIEGFELVPFESRYRVRLASPAPEYRVVCGFYYGSRYQSVFRRAEGKELVGRIDDRAVQPLLRVGQGVVIRGKCAGLDEGQIRFTSCEVVR